MTFKNETTGHVVTASSPALWAFLFGFFYFMVHGVWSHAVIYFLIVLATGGLAAPFLWVGYAIAANNIIASHYTSKGYKVQTP